MRILTLIFLFALACAGAGCSSMGSGGLRGASATGKVKSVFPPGNNCNKSTAGIHASCDVGTAGFPCRVRFTAQADPGIEIQSWSWGIDGVSHDTGKSPSSLLWLSFTKPGSVVAHVTATDTAGNTYSDMTGIQLRQHYNSPPVALMEVSGDLDGRALPIKFSVLPDYDSDGVPDYTLPGSEPDGSNGLLSFDVDNSYDPEDGTIVFPDVLLEADTDGDGRPDVVVGDVQPPLDATGKHWLPANFRIEAARFRSGVGYWKFQCDDANGNETTLTGQVRLHGSSYGVRVAADDLDGDGKAEVDPGTTSTGEPGWVQLGDLNGDGIQDLTSFSWGSSYDFDDPIVASEFILTGDVDGDGSVDRLADVANSVDPFPDPPGKQVPGHSYHWAVRGTVGSSASRAAPGDYQYTVSFTTASGRKKDYPGHVTLMK